MTTQPENNTNFLLGINVPVIGVTGPMYSGKSLFAAQLCPTEQLNIDCEESTRTYNIPFKKRVDLFEMMGKLHPDGWKPVDAFNEFYKSVKALKPGEYRVIVVDPISDIEQGLADYVASNFKDYGFGSRQKFESTGGIFWSNVLAFWKQVLGEITAKCEIFCFTTHMRDVWMGGRPTGRKEPKGKKTLFELASLYLCLDRKPVDGKTPDAPSANVLKSRLAKTAVDEKTGLLQIVQVLPMRLPVATPEAIRAYVEKPVDVKKLKKGELVEADPEMTDDEKLQLQLEIAEANREAEQAKTQRVEMMAEAAQRQAAVAQSARKPATEAETTQATDATTTKVTGQEGQTTDDLSAKDGQVSALPHREEPPFESAENPAPAEPGADGRLPVEMIELLHQQRQDLGITEEQWSGILAKRGVGNTIDLPFTEAVEIHSKLWSKLTQRDMEEDRRQWYLRKIIAAGVDAEK